MLQDDSSVRGSADAAWFAMPILNDPNAALIATLRPPREHAIVTALRRRFQKLGPEVTGDEVRAARELQARLRSRTPLWVAGALLALGVGAAVLAAGGFASAASIQAPAPVRIGSTVLEARTPRAPAAAAATARAVTAAPAATPAAAPARDAQRVPEANAPSISHHERLADAPPRARVLVKAKPARAKPVPNRKSLGGSRPRSSHTSSVRRAGAYSRGGSGRGSNG